MIARAAGLLMVLLPATSAAQDVRWHSDTLFSARRALDGRLVAPVQQYVFAEAGGPRDNLSFRMDLRGATDSKDLSTAGLEVFELFLRAGRAEDWYEAVVGRQVLFVGTRALLADAATLTLRPASWVDIILGGGIERHPEVEQEVLGPHLVATTVRLRGLASTVRLSYLLRDDRAGRTEHRLGLTAWHVFDVVLTPELEVTVEGDASSERLLLAEASATVHPTAALALSVSGSRVEPLPWGPVLGEGIWGLFMSGPTDRGRARAAWNGPLGSVAASCSLYVLRPLKGDVGDGRTCRAAWFDRWSWLRPSLAGFYLDGDVGTAAGGGVGLRADIWRLRTGLRAEVAWFRQPTGLRGLACWLRSSVRMAVGDRLYLRLVGEGGRRADLDHEVRVLTSLSYSFRGVRP